MKPATCYKKILYLQVGRSVATIMSNPTFYTIANAATGGADLLSALDDFLDMSCVLPPGEVSWDWVLFVGVHEIQ